MRDRVAVGLCYFYGFVYLLTAVCELYGGKPNLLLFIPEKCKQFSKLFLNLSRGESCVNLPRHKLYLLHTNIDQFARGNRTIEVQVLV